ncbi:cell division topological specificity factor MinE [Rhizobiales bacterium GAS191]|jgi:cell division topological specificity factor|nr:cell division topological specificity factor MinE [Rhizobiales bacterium GAS113]SEB93531.1 cell division topological specificity factor MinE [Rhizobiales bacterium GAS188]SED29897.1 cell division topological specificity factor MinE [Rhizobiales bacterium GAS191]
MNLFGIFGRRGSAPVARERLQILLAHERNGGCNSDLIAVLHKEVLEAISKHVHIDPDKVDVKMHRREAMSLLEIDIEIETPGKDVSGMSKKEDGFARFQRAG